MKNTREAGFILITVYLLLAVLLVHATALITHSFGENRGAQRFQMASQSFYLSEGGIDRAYQWLRTQAAPPAGTQPMVLFGGWQIQGEGLYLATVDPDDANAGSFTKRYTIEGWGATGTQAAPTSLRRTRLTVQTESFSRYAYFTNSETSPSGSQIWFITGDRIEGPTHSNSQFNMRGTPVFDGLVSSTASSVNLAGGGPPTSNPAFNGGLQLNAPPVSLAQASTADLATQANNGGTRYNGDTQITLLANGTMRVTNAAANLNNQVVALPGNGVLYVNNGSVTMQGTLQGQLTVATNRDVRVANNITYSQDPRVNPNSTDLLGIVTDRNVVVASGAPQNVQIHASLMALGSSFTVENWSVGPPKGTLTVLGGIIQSNRGPVGTFNSSTGTKVSGYTKDYHYDARLMNSVPPFFPTTGNYVPVVWEEEQ